MAEELYVANQLMRPFSPLILNTVIALLLLLFGWVMGRIIGTLAKKILRKLKIDKYFKLDKGIKLSEIISLVISWIIYFVFIQSAVAVLGITTLTNVFGGVIRLVSGLLGGLIVILVGYVVGKYVQGQITKSKTEYSGALGQLMFFFTMVVTISIALELASIPTKLINNIILILVASVGIGLAIALGLGLKDTVSKLAKKYEKRL